MCDGTTTTMFSNQNSLRCCWIIYTNNQGSERISTTTETRTSAITSGSVAPITTVGSSTVTTTTSKQDKNQVENSEYVESEQETSQRTKINDQKLNQDEQEKADSESIDSMHLMLEPHLRPVSPDPNSRLSSEIFDEHKQLAQEYLKVQTEIAYVTKHREELLAAMDPEQRAERLEFFRKLEEKQALLQLHANLKRQLQLIRSNTRPPPSNISNQPNIPQQPSQINPNEPQNSDLVSTTTNEDGWVYVSSQSQS